MLSHTALASDDVGAALFGPRMENAGMRTHSSQRSPERPERRPPDSGGSTERRIQDQPRWLQIPGGRFHRDWLQVRSNEGRRVQRNWRTYSHSATCPTRSRGGRSGRVTKRPRSERLGAFLLVKHEDYQCIPLSKERHGMDGVFMHPISQRLSHAGK